MKFLVIGLGSMGKRRIRNLKYLGEEDIIGFDPREDRRKEAEEKHNINVCDSIEKAMNQNPNVFIISTPPDHHLEYELLAAENNKHFFCEAGLFTQGLEELIALCQKKDIVAAPSATLYFKDSIKLIKQFIEQRKIGNIVAISYHLGQYLPDWHPWENITDFYAGKKETSATREMVVFELNWLTWIFGKIDKISCMKDKLSDLKTDIDDVYQLIFRFKNRILGNMLIEVVSRTATRKLRIIGDQGTIEWDWSADTVKVFDPKTKEWTEFQEQGFAEPGYVAKENMYIEEIKTFLQAINKQGEYPYTLKQDYELLTLLKKAEESAMTDKHIKI
jgi:predicted dehydrogenase